MWIIALTGWSESGKDTVADLLVKHYGFKKYAIASPLKDLCSRLYGFPRDLAETQEGKKSLWKVGYTSKTIRQLLLETAVVDRSRFGDCIYINEVLSQIQQDNHQLVVIPDLRYFTELHAIKRFLKKEKDTFEIWKIVREGQNESPVKDVSEYGMETIRADRIIENDGVSLETLKQKVSEAITRKQNELSNSENEDDGCCIL